LKDLIEKAWEERSLLENKETQIAIKTTIDELDRGIKRVAEPDGIGGWKINEWIKKAIILYFPIQKMQVVEVGPFEFHDKIKLKSGFDKLGVRVVPHALARYGSYLSKGVVMMPSYV